MNNADQILKAFNGNLDRLPEYRAKVDNINARIRGWSNSNHYLFFKSWMDAFPEARNVLIVGVYLGRDISYMFDAAGERALNVTGVDKFNAEPCDDWPKEKLHMTWEEAFFCPPPDIEKARENIKPSMGLLHSLNLVKADDKVWLEGASGAYDLIFLDASHEYASISRQLRAVHKLCHPFTIVSGDDYANVQPGWGVEDAVKHAFKTHHHIDNRIWFAGAEDYL